MNAQVINDWVDLTDAVLAGRGTVQLSADRFGETNLGSHEVTTVYAGMPA
jgi:hypothetical protein